MLGSNHWPMHSEVLLLNELGLAVHHISGPQAAMPLTQATLHTKVVWLYITKLVCVVTACEGFAHFHHKSQSHQVRAQMAFLEGRLPCVIGCLFL